MIKTTSNLPGRWCCCSLFSATLYSFFSIKIDFPWGSSSPKQSPKQIRQVLSPLSFHHPVDASNRGLCSYLSRSCSFSILELTNWSTLSFLVFSFWIWWKLQDYLIHQLGKAKPKVFCPSEWKTSTVFAGRWAWSNSIPWKDSRWSCFTWNLLVPFPPLIHLKNSAKFSRWVFWGKSALLKVLLMDVCFMPSFWTESMVLWEYDFTTAEVIESAVAMGLCGRHGFLETRQRLNDRLWRYRISWRFLATQHSEPDFKLEERPACFFFQKVGAGKSSLYLCILDPGWDGKTTW